MSALLLPLVLLLALSSSLPSLSAQYACPLIEYQQSVTPSTHPLLPSSPSFSLSFINHSPNLPLSFLDVHYSINGANPTNLRLHPTGPTNPTPPFILQPTDLLDYSFTYQVQGLDLSCDTQHFHATGSDVQTSGEGRVDAPKAAPTPPPLGVPVTLEPLHTTNPTIKVPPMELATDQPTAEAPVTSAHPRDVLDQNAGVCPLIPFKQEMERRGRDWSLLFHNLSPSVALEFLDVHLAINGGPESNRRLFTGGGGEGGSGVRALDGLVMTEGDVVEYSFTYGVRGGEGEGESEGVKVRACNTEVFSTRVVEK